MKCIYIASNVNSFLFQYVLSYFLVRFGSAAVWINDRLYRICLFYDDILDTRKIKFVKEFGEKLQKQKDNCIVTVLPKSEFVTKIFYPYVYEARVKLVGFDLPYQISRLATSWGIARKMQDAFSMKLVEHNPRLPAIRIKSINSNSAMIQFVTPLRKKSEKKSIPVSKVYRGCFVDVKTLAYVTTNNSFDEMNTVAKIFSVDVQYCKEKIQENVQNALTLHKIYCKITEVLANTFLVRPNQINILYSPASIGNTPLVSICGTCSNDTVPELYIAATTGKATRPITPSFVLVLSETFSCMLYVLMFIQIV